MVATTVVSAGAGGGFVIDAGAKILAQDVAPFIAGHGAVVGYPDAVIQRLNDHHGVVDLPAGAARPAVGTIVWVVPNHVCPVINLVDTFVVAQGGRVGRHVARRRARQERLRASRRPGRGRCPRRRGSPRDAPRGWRRRAGRAAAPPCNRPRSTAARRAPLPRRGSGPRRPRAGRGSRCASRASGRPETLAEVVGSGPTAAASARGASWSGTRNPMVGVPPVSAAGNGTSGRCGTTTVSPPGQHASASAVAAAPITPIEPAWDAASSSSMIPRSGGRRFTWNSRSMPPGTSRATAIP